MWIARRFFRSFFPTLFLAVSAAQWAVIAWVVVVAAGVRVPWPLHVLAIGAVYMVNRRLTAMRRGGRGAPAFRVYTATAFTSLFCAAFLAITWVAFTAVDGVLGVLSAQALGTAGQMAVQAGVGDLYHWTGSFGITAIALLMGYGYFAGQHELRVHRQPVPVGSSFATRRAARRSATSTSGRTSPPSNRERFVDLVNEVDADLVCITGDIADSPRPTSRPSSRSSGACGRGTGCSRSSATTITGPGPTASSMRCTATPTSTSSATRR